MSQCTKLADDSPPHIKIGQKGHQRRGQSTGGEGKGQIKFEESNSDDSNGEYKHNNDDTVDDDSKGNDDKDDDDDKRGRAAYT